MSTQTLAQFSFTRQHRKNNHNKPWLCHVLLVISQNMFKTSVQKTQFHKPLFAKKKTETSQTQEQSRTPLVDSDRPQKKLTSKKRVQNCALLAQFQSGMLEPVVCNRPSTGHFKEARRCAHIQLHFDYHETHVRCLFYEENEHLSCGGGREERMRERDERLSSVTARNVKPDETTNP